MVAFEVSGALDRGERVFVGEDNLVVEVWRGIVVLMV